MKNKILAVIFILMLTLPTLVYPLFSGVIDTENHENREYAAFPEISAHNWQNIPGGIEAYYTDRIPFKNQLTALNSRVERFFKRHQSDYELLGFNGYVTEGKEEWLYYTVRKGDTQEVEDSVGELLGENLYDEERLVEIAEDYRRLNRELEDSGSEFYFYLAPGKEQVYTEYLPDGIIERLPELDRGSQLVDHISENTDVDVIYPREALREGKDAGRLFYKYDTHWNYVGSYIGHQELIKAMGLSGTDIKDLDVVVDDEAKVPNDLATLLGLMDEYQDDHLYRVLGYKPEVTVDTILQREDGKFFHYKSDSPDRRRVLIVGDSFMGGLNKYLPSDFGELWAVADIEEAAQVYLDNKPEVVIFECAQRMYGRQEDFCREFLWYISQDKK